MTKLSHRPIDAARLAGRALLRRVEGEYRAVDALIFGSYARGEQTPDSDVDLAVILEGEPGRRWAAATFMAAIAFDVMQETGVLLDPLPLWQSELEAPETFSNPALIRAIRRDGQRL